MPIETLRRRIWWTSGVAVALRVAIPGADDHQTRPGRSRAQPSVSGGAAQALSEARSTTDHAIQSVRDLSQLLHPAMLDDFGLAVTLDAYVRSFSTRTGVRTDLVLDRMDARLASELEICVYRVVKEALTNGDSGSS